MQLSRSRSRRAAIGAALVLGVAVALGGCAPLEPMPIPSPTPSYTSTYETPAPTALAPLTGSRCRPEASPTRRSRPRSTTTPTRVRRSASSAPTSSTRSSSRAGSTRYVAIWQSDVPAEIGPVRSIRPMDPDIVSPLGGIIAYSGGQQRFVALMRSTNVYNAIHGQSRHRRRHVPHEDQGRAAQRARQGARAARDAPRHPRAAAAVLLSRRMRPDRRRCATAPRSPRINLAFSRSSARSWTADPATGRWLRSQDGAADLDDAGAQLSAANVIVLRVPVTVSQSIPKTELIGSGEAWVSTGGRTIHATWCKGDRLAPIRLVDDTGTVIRLAPGNSWIELVPNAGSVEFVAAPAA